jgi:MATE family multidrug resistance protein
MTSVPLSVPAVPMAWHLRQTFRLAMPIIASRVAILAMTVGDSTMTGWAGADELAALGLGVAPQLTLQMVAIGFLQATPIMTAQTVGAGDTQKAGSVLRAGLAHAFALALLFIALSLLSARLFRLTGQPEAVIGPAASVGLAYALGLPGLLLFLACNMFLEATGRPKAGMAVMVAAALIDLALNGVFALGWGGLVEPMGAVGTIATSSAMRTLAFVAVLVILLTWEKRLGDPHGVLRAIRLPTITSIGRRMRRIGVPMGLAQGVESAGFSAMVFLGGLISAEALAAHQATLTLLSLIYMSAVGIGNATAIRVGQAVGRGSSAELRLAGRSGIVLAGAMTIPFALAMLLTPELVARLFGLEDDALRLTAATIGVGGLVVTLDAMMGGSLGALRGAGDVWVAFAIQVGAFWIVAVPVAALLGIHAGFGAPGLIYGILAGVGLSFVLLALRFQVISGRAVRRV